MSALVPLWLIGAAIMYREVKRMTTLTRLSISLAWPVFALLYGCEFLARLVVTDLEKRRGEKGSQE